MHIHSCGYRHLRSIGSLGGTQHKRSSQLLGLGLHLCHKSHTSFRSINLVFINIVISVFTSAIVVFTVCVL